MSPLIGPPGIIELVYESIECKLSELHRTTKYSEGFIPAWWILGEDGTGFSAMIDPKSLNEAVRFAAMSAVIHTLRNSDYKHFQDPDIYRAHWRLFFPLIRLWRRKRNESLTQRIQPYSDIPRGYEYDVPAVWPILYEFVPR